MIPDEHGHEDVMREGVSLTRRIECRYPDRQAPVVLGFNDLDWLFIYPEGDGMYRFDDQGRLRRAFVDGLLYRTSGHTLATLSRQGRQSMSNPAERAQSILLRRDLLSDELNTFRERTLALIEELYRGLRIAVMTRQFPTDIVDPIGLFEQGLKRVLESTSFLAPAIVRR